jgi:Matrixin
MTRLKTLALLAGSLAAAATPAAAYYHFVHYLNSAPPYAVAFERFDLTALPDKTVTFFVSDSGPTSYTQNDSFPSVLEQIRNATQVWNSVASSDLRVAFGGLQVVGTPQSVPTGEVVFEELPPGLLAYAGPESTATLTATANGIQFVPITLSVIHLNIDMTQQPGPEYTDSYTGPSYSETFFMTLVHEIGHAIGLQHTYTSATMSTAVSRATNRSRPLDADDIAGVSLLYPAGGFPASYGSISGHVTMGGQGVHMASVVAILPNGSAVGSLTNPDGSYEIDGLPPGNYWVYVHPLPATDYIISPLDPNNNPVPQSGPFTSTFYNGGSGTWDPSQFTSVPIAQGASAANIDFSVQPRLALEVYDVTSYWWTGSNYVQPALVNADAALTSSPQVVAQGVGVTSGTSSTNVQSVLALGAPGGWLADFALQPYQDADTTLLEMSFDYTSPPAPGPEHLLFTLPDDIFMLPWGLRIVQNPPPVVTAATPNPDGSLTLTGTGLNANSLVYFDSLPARIAIPFAVSPSDPSGQTGLISVIPPPGGSGQTATMTVFNSDGQNSTFLQPLNPFTYFYPQADVPVANISISQLPQGVSAMVTVTAANMQFVDGMTTLGFGSGDVAVRRLWVLPPAQSGTANLCGSASACAIANVTVAPAAFQQQTVASVIAGFQVYEQAQGFQVTPANPMLAVINLPVTNAFYPVQNSLYPGSIASIYGQNLQAAASTPVITLAGQNAQILYTSPTQINFVIPVEGVPTGPAVLALQGAFPIVVQIDPPPPVIVSAADTGFALGGTQTAAPGDAITLTVSGMYAPPAQPPASSRIGVAEGGVSIPVFTVQQAQDGSNNLLIQFALTASVTGQQVPVTVSLDGDLSMPFYIDIAAAPALSGSN